jgi:hypothetical protein
MTTTREIQAARDERMRRQKRYYGPHNLGRRCRGCRMRLPLVLDEAGVTMHACCEVGWL